MDLGLRGDRYIEVDELEPLKQRIGKYLLQKNPVKVDGKSAKPILDRTNYVKVGLTGIQILEVLERLEIDAAIAGVIISYITDGMPQQVKVDWELFTDQIQRVPATSTDPAGPLPTYLTPEDNVHTWTNYLKNYEMPTVHRTEVAESLGALRIPVVSLLCLAGFLGAAGWTVASRRHAKPLRLSLTVAALCLATAAAAYPFAQVTVNRPAFIAGELNDARAAALLETLLKNVYRAFDFREEEDVYDKLALTVSGELLTDIYLQNRRSMAIQQAGGAQAKIKEVAVEAARAARVDGEDLTYALHGTWTALGTVGLVSGILAPRSGEVRVAGTDIGALSDSDRRAFRIRAIGFVFQDFELLDYLNVLDNILHPYRISALRLDRTVRERAERLAERLGVGDKLKRHPDHLSQGEKQRVTICRALLPGPQLLLADEATGNLDPRNKGRILDLLFDSVDAHGATLLAVTHDHELLPRLTAWSISPTSKPIPSLIPNGGRRHDRQHLRRLALPDLQLGPQPDAHRLRDLDRGTAPVAGAAARRERAPTAGARRVHPPGGGRQGPPSRDC